MPNHVINSYTKFCEINVDYECLNNNYTIKLRESMHFNPSFGAKAITKQLYFKEKS